MPRGPAPDVSAAEILRFMVEHPDRAFTAGELAEEFDKTRQWADNRLKIMEDDGYVKSKNPGGRSRFYWPTDEGKRYLHSQRRSEN